MSLTALPGMCVALPRSAGIWTGGSPLRPIDGGRVRDGGAGLNFTDAGFALEDFGFFTEALGAEGLGVLVETAG